MISNTMGNKLSELFKSQKIQIIIGVTACVLIFYVIGIVTNFFANPIFSMFFIISRETAHSVVALAATAVAVALSLLLLSTSLIKKRKTVLPETINKPAIGTIKAPTEVPVRSKPPSPLALAFLAKQRVRQTPSQATTQATSQATPQAPKQPTKQPTTQIPTQPKTYRKLASNQEATINQDKITCPTCKKEFNQPIYRLDYRSSKPKLKKYCPYCKRNIDALPKTTIENDSFKMHVTQLQNQFVKKP